MACFKSDLNRFTKERGEKKRRSPFTCGADSLGAFEGRGDSVVERKVVLAFYHVLCFFFFGVQCFFLKKISKKLINFFER